jgi:predicted membrane channel-forming protein YqfA (hemolysin III family)
MVGILAYQKKKKEKVNGWDALQQPWHTSVMM